MSTEEEVVLTVRQPEVSSFQNFNVVPGIDNLLGGKIGETLAAGKTSITIHNIADAAGKDRPVAIIILGSKERNKDVAFIHSYFTERFR